MWCSQCQADVATEISANGQQLLCTTCGEEVRKVFAPSQHPETVTARALLEKWSLGQLVEDDASQVTVAQDQPAVDQAPRSSAVNKPATSTAQPAVAPPAPAPTLSVRPAEKNAAPTGRPPVSPNSSVEDSGVDLLPAPRSRGETGDRPIRKIHRGSRPASRREPPADSPRSAVPLNWRIDDAHEDVRTPPGQAVEPRPTSRPAEAISTGVDLRDDRPHEQAPSPHFDLDRFMSPSPAPGKQESIFGQLLAYVGVGMLTIGTVLVVWGYFGGPEVQRYQSTGWLISTAGQMLLFLGVVTLVSGGMQQTTHEVSQRVEYLGNRMIRIEQSTQELLKGPYFGRTREGSRVASGSDSKTDPGHGS